MSANEHETVRDAGVAKMRRARERPAVLKADLVNLKGRVPGKLIFVFEGDDDKGVYFQWVRQAVPSLRYEPFVCNGKRFVLQLLDVVERDLDDLGNGVYFFVDRDFDDLQGRASVSSLYMTEKYSVENYLVDSEVLSETLTNEYGCHAEPELREELVAKFMALYDSFLAETKSVNFRIFAAKRLGIELHGHLSFGIGRMVNVTVDSVSRTGRTDSELVRLERELSDEEVRGLQAEFEALTPRDRYRGKFAVAFFIRWLSELASDRVSTDDGCFTGLKRGVRVNVQELTLSNFAGKSTTPPSLREFLQGVAV